MPLAKDRAITTKGARGLFLKSFVTRRRRLVYPLFCEVVPSHVEQDFARSIGTVPQLEEVIDDVNNPMADDFRDYAWNWRNRLYRATVGVQRSLFDFDQTGQTRTLMDSLAARVANLPDQIFFTRLLAGSFNGGDGVALFSAAHPAPIGSATLQSNIVTGTSSTAFCSVSSVQAVANQILADFRSARAQMRSLLDDHSQPWHNDEIRSEDLVVLCSPLLEAPMELAFFGQTIGATDNIMRGKVRQIVTSNYLPLTGAQAADWYLCNVGEIKRPFQYSSFRRIKDAEIEDSFEANQQEYAAAGINIDDLKEFSSIRLETNLSKQGMNAEADVMQNDRILFNARWRGEMFGGEWRNAIQIDNAAA